jgi:protease-4
MSDDAQTLNSKIDAEKTLEKLLLATLKEQKSQRRWKIFFRLCYLILFIAVFLFIRNSMHPTATADKFKPHTALITLEGEISATDAANATDIIDSLDAAFEDSNTQGVIISINSPGGSPVQANEIYNEIKRQRKLHPKIKLYAVCEDICASGSYYVAAAADDIYVNPSSLVGSIGVLMDGFGFVGTMDKLGVQRRLATAGSHKGFMDPFSPESESDKIYLQTMLDDLHNQFINSVKAGRGNRLKNDPDLFSGLVWTGDRAVQLGLADDFGSVNDVARDVIKAEDLVDYTVKPNPLSNLMTALGVSSAKTFAKVTGLSAEPHLQ